MAIGAIGASGLSFQPRSEINAVSNRLQQTKGALKDSPIPSNTALKIESVLTNLKTFMESKSMSMEQYEKTVKDVVALMDHLGDIDESFIQDMLDSAQADRKRDKQRMMTDFLNDQAQRGPAIPAAGAMNATSMSSVSGAFKSSSSDLSSDSRSPEWTIDQQSVDDQTLGGVLSKAQENTELRGPRHMGGRDRGPVFTEDDAKASGVDMQKVHDGSLGDVAALAGAAREFRASHRDDGSAKKEYHYTVGSAVLSVVKSGQFTKEEILDKLKGMLKNGVKDLGDITTIMKLLGELGTGVPKDLLNDISDALTDFVSDQAQNATSLKDFLSFMKAFQSLTSEFGGNVIDGDLGSSLSNVAPTKDNVASADELSSMGIIVELTDEIPDAKHDPLQRVESAMSGQKGVEFQVGNPLLEALAGAMGASSESKKQSDVSHVSVDEHKALDPVAQVRVVQPVDSKSTSSLVDLSKETKLGSKEDSPAMERKGASDERRASLESKDSSGGVKDVHRVSVEAKEVPIHSDIVHDRVRAQDSVRENHAEFLATQRQAGVQSVTGKSSSSQMDLGTGSEERDHLIQLLSDVAEKLKVPFANSTVDAIQKFMDARLAGHLDQLL